MESRDHHVGHVHLLGQGRTSTPYINGLASFLCSESFFSFVIIVVICVRAAVAVVRRGRVEVLRGADLDLLLEQVDLVLLLDQLLLLLGDLRHKTRTFSHASRMCAADGHTRNST